VGAVDDLKNWVERKFAFFQKLRTVIGKKARLRYWTGNKNDESGCSEGLSGYKRETLSGKS